MIYLLLLAWSKSNQKIKAEPASLLRSLRSLSRLKLASLKQQTLRALTAVSALYAHQLRPEIEPDGSIEDCETDSSYAIPHRVREQVGSILVPVLDTGPQRNRQYRPSQEKGLSGRA